MSFCNTIDVEYFYGNVYLKINQLQHYETLLFIYIFTTNVKFDKLKLDKIKGGILMAILKGTGAKGLLKGANAIGVLQGLAGNLSEVSSDELAKEYGQYLLDVEEIEVGYKLIRDAMIVTNLRIIDVDKQGATGKKTRANTIFLNTIVNVTAETAGFGLDDSEITITYINSPNHRGNTVTTTERKFEFPKKYDISMLYKKFLSLAVENMNRING
jgi:hypothetical protein